MERDALTADAAPTKDAWRDRLSEIGAAEGFYEELGAQHTALHVKRGDTLIVTFENLDDVYKGGESKMPWGFGFVEKRGWSMLGLMAHDWTWYRDEAVYDFFDQLRDEGFFDGFKRVVFYGASMGGYAAAAFSAACPGAGVVTISPQATLSREDASWETRYRKAWSRDFSTRYGYAPDMLATASYAYVFYDPLAPLDAMHAALFRGENIRKMRCRYFGHRIASMWIQLGILTEVVEGAIEGTLTNARFYHLLRGRRDNRRYQREMLERLNKKGRPALVAQYCEAVMARKPGPKFRNALKAANKKLGR
ncbi:phosphoadenosine phosphosulfate reductase [Celeribacter sp.]|uniref:phosphoadenosine phosphosulfate reductase n=1 Tax=Celeribacter sp. TaxID=1890673 RepID=UPI003A9179C2